MKVIVCVKQVPASSVPLDSAGNLLRGRGSAQLNPGDAWAIEAALQLAEAMNGTVTALTMGPASAETVLRTALSMGGSQGVQMTDRAFAGADVYATAHTLAEGIRCLGGADYVVCGQQSTDGDTAQLPFSLAAQLGIPALGWVKKLQLDGEKLTVLQELSQGTQQAELPCPCVLAVGKEIGTPRIPSLRARLRAKNQEIRVLTLSDLSDPEPAHYGLSGSPTRVVRASETVRTVRNQPLVLNGADSLQCLRKLREEVQSRG